MIDAQVVGPAAGAGESGAGQRSGASIVGANSIVGRRRRAPRPEMPPDLWGAKRGLKAL